MRQVKTLSLFTVAAGTMLLGAVAGLAGAEAATAPPAGGPVSAATAPHIMTIMMENTDYSQFVGSPAMPFLNEMAHEYVDFTQAFGWHYPSLPNYLELLSGWRENVSGDCDINQKGCRDFTNPTLATQLEARGLSWNAYYQGDPKGCYQGDGSGNYPYWHNPFRYFADFSKQCSHISNFSKLLSNLSSSDAADFQWVVPDLVNSGGDNGTMSSGDSWLAGELPKIMATNWYTQGGQIVILYDTGYNDSGGNGGASGGRIPLVVVSSHARGMGAIASPVNTAGVLRSIEHAYGLAYLGNAAQADNGSLEGALVAGRPTGATPPPSESGAFLSTSGSTPVSVPGTLALNGIARVPVPPEAEPGAGSPGGSGAPGTIEVGQDSAGAGVVTSRQAGTVAVAGTSDLESIACATPTTCYAVGLAPSAYDEAALVKIVEGKPKQTTLLPDFIGLYGIACPGPSTCYAVGYDSAGDADAVTTITDGQASGPKEVKQGGEWLNAISCPTSTKCYAAGLVNYSPSIVPIDAGIPGTPVTIPDSWYLNGIDCWKAASCVVVGENKTEEGIVDIVTGSTAPAPKVIKESEYLYGAGCDSSGDCVLTGASTPGADGYSTAIVVDWAKGAASSPRTIAATNGFGQVVCAGAGLGACLSVGEKFAPPGA